MLRNKLFKGVLGVSAVATLFAALAAQAQTSAGQQPTTGQQPTSGQQSSSSQSGSSQSGGSTGQGMAGQTASGQGAAMGKSDQKIIINMAMANMAEVEAAKVAQSKSQNQQVKTFAQQMIDDHGKALSEVQQLAQAKGVILPAVLDKTHKAKNDKLAALSGDAFDKTYLAQAGVADHKKSHGMLQQAQKRAKDPDIKALAARLSPTVDQHLTSAQQLHSTHSTARGSSGTAAEKSGQ